MPERNEFTFKPAGQLGRALTVFLWLSVATAAWVAGESWYRLVVQDHSYGRGDGLTVSDGVEGVVGVGATVLFILWLWRVRSNAEFLCRAQHRRGRGWVVGAWFVPVINLWWPKQIVDDVIAASDPQTPPFTPNLKGIRPALGVMTWWLTWLGSTLVAIIGTTVEPYPDAPDHGLALAAAILFTVETVLTGVSAWFVVRIIERIGHDQSSRPPVAWWASDQHLAGGR